MIHFAHCVNCSRSSKQPYERSAWVHVSLSHSEHCSSCNHSHEKKKDIFFCSMQCLILFATRNPDRLLVTEQHFVTNERVYIATYKDPLYDPNPPQPDATLQLNQAEQELIRKGSVILAIKELRARTGLGLKECKDITDRFRNGRF